MIAIIIKALSDSLLQALFGFIQSEMRDRGLIQQGREQQHAADLESTVKEARDAAKIHQDIEAKPIGDVDADLQRLRDAAAHG